MKTFWTVTGMVVAALGVSALLVAGHQLFNEPSSQASPAAQDLPWLISTTGDGGSQVMGLRLTTEASQASTLGDALNRWGDKMTVAVIAAPNEVGSLEAYVDPMQAGFIGGKLVITAQATPAQIEAFKRSTRDVSFMESTTRQFKLSGEALQKALRAPIVALGFIPQANLDEATIVARFGQPTERVRVNDELTHLLYPAQGLDIAVSTSGKELLQYVAPADFDTRLRAPLAASVAAGASSPAAAAASTPVNP
jgi:hypothetical protein